MDRLIVLDRGRIVEEGSHRQLLAHGGLYARLWEHQSGGFLGDQDESPALPAADASNEEIEPEAEEARPREAAHIGHDQLTGSEPR
jgi:hypothetical protein